MAGVRVVLGENGLAEGEKQGEKQTHGNSFGEWLVALSVAAVDRRLTPRLQVCNLPANSLEVCQEPYYLA
jgi:hypothetical protein